ncbi:hypothetical protein lerEdw1_004478 [Lerista edwardsae]|nr:hypothetical protein lerEdw1_004478 [Lerista edwardsae]
MTHILLIFSILLCFGHLAQALVCDVCEKLLEGWGAAKGNWYCDKGQGTCVAEPGEKCIFITKKAQGLVCDVCKNFKPPRRCRKGEGTCEAEPGQKCIFIITQTYSPSPPTKIIKKTSVRRCSVPGDVCDRNLWEGRTVTKTNCCDHMDHCLYPMP